MPIVSPTAPFQLAVERTRRALFRPFSLGKWAVMGIGLTLARCDEGGGNSLPTDNDVYRALVPLAEWMQANPAQTWFIVALSSLAILVVLAIRELLVCRGAFIYLDNVLSDEPRFGEPWGRLAPQANSLALFRVVCLLPIVPATLAAVGLFLATAGREPTATSVQLAASLGFLSALLLWIPFGTAAALAKVFAIVPMYKEGIGAFEAMSRVVRELFLQRFLSMLLFCLLGFVLLLGVATAMLLVGCLTLCLGFLPYINSVVMLPGFVFVTHYKLAFLDQLGPRWSLIAASREEELSEVFR